MVIQFCNRSPEFEDNSNSMVYFSFVYSCDCCCEVRNNVVLFCIRDNSGFINSGQISTNLTFHASFIWPWYKPHVAMVDWLGTRSLCFVGWICWCTHQWSSWMPPRCYPFFLHEHLQFLNIILIKFMHFSLQY